MKDLKDVLIIEPPRKFSLNLTEIWQYRELFYFFTWRDVKVKYKQTALGVVWVVMQPLLMVVIFTLFFGRTLKINTAPLPYPLFVFSGLLLWNFFSSSIITAGNSMLNNASIIKKIYFPRIIIPTSSLLVSFIDLSIAFVVFLGMLMYYAVDVSLLSMLIFWPLALLITVIGTLGLGSLLSALTVKYRDFRYVVPFGLQLALFVSPVIYPATVTGHAWVGYCLAVNPMYAAITLFRAGLMPMTFDMPLLFISMVSTVIFLMLGLYYFRRTEAYFADIA
ncbi:ABC transporter permease [Dawidia soli]|uniref:Transport permease protein n=1 Tax=Dawidia soli TaxID=2782352 RepID=A0AAP2GH11_9BACT|nr:ABC transporter permease [Dawidia soli]MBT1686721.1 ABC transporter permease [Dawidia soli]